MLWLALASWFAASPAPPPAPDRWLTDRVGLISPAARERLDLRLEGFERATGHQLLVWIDQTTGGEPIEVFAERAFKAWKPGRSGLDDGVVLFVFAGDRTVRLEVGYGLEPVLTDAVCSRILSERVAPLLQTGDAEGALTEGVEAVITALGGAPAPPPVEPRELTTAEWVALGIALVGFLVLLIVRPDLALRLISVLLFLRRGSGRDRSGFMGRGGRSGGGGASHRW